MVWRTAILATLFVMQITSISALAQEDHPDLFDPADPSKAFDITDVPLGVALLQSAALELRDATTKKQFSGEFEKLKGEISSAIDGKAVGYLLKVEIYTDEFGTPIIPADQLIFPIGVGTEPADSLAEFIRQPQLQRGPPMELRNESYYLWVKMKAGRMIGHAIPREFREQLEHTALKEATRRNLLGQWERALPPEGIKVVQRAQYWNDVSERYTKYLRSQQRVQQVEGMRKDFQAAQDKFNDAYRSYQQTVADLSRQQQFSQALATISTIVQVLDTASQLGAFGPTNNSSKSVRTDATPQADLGATVRFTETKIDYLSGSVEQRSMQIRIQGDELLKLDDNLRDIFKKDGVPIPRAEDRLNLPRP